MNNFEFKFIENELKKIGVIHVFYDISFSSISLSKTLSCIAFFKYKNFIFSIHFSMDRASKHGKKITPSSFINKITTEINELKNFLYNHFFRDVEFEKIPYLNSYISEGTLCDFISKEVMSITRLDFNNNSFNPVGYSEEHDLICHKVKSLNLLGHSSFHSYLTIISEFSDRYDNLLRVEKFFIF